MKTLVILIATLSVLAHANNTGGKKSTTLNSMCFIENDKAPTPFTPTEEERRDLEKRGVVDSTTTDKEMRQRFAIASVSKVLTTHWALLRLGPFYRFETQFKIAATSKPNVCDIHIVGSMDPYFGIEMMDRAWQQVSAQASKLGCQKISSLSVNDKFRFRTDLFDYRKRGQRSAIAWTNPQFKSGFGSAFSALKKYMASNKFLKIEETKVEKKDTDAFDDEYAKFQVKTYAVKSRMLFQMMKDYNKVSYNYPPEILFEKLGGAQAYAQFVKARLKTSDSDFEMYNGSGYPGVFFGVKRYNKASCAGITLALRDTDAVLKSLPFEPMQLADVLGVGGRGETFTTFSGSRMFGDGRYTNKIVGKTGTADGAITFAGMFTILGGKIYFGVLTNPIAGDGVARSDIKRLVDSLMDRYDTTTFAYKPQGDMTPFDKESALAEVGGAVANPIAKR